MKTKPLASIDIGTNTFRLLIAEVKPDPKRNNYSIKEIHSERIITRLGEGIPEDGLIKKEAINRGIAVLKKFSNIISHHYVYKTSAIATSALRDAKNSSEFLKKVKDATGLEIEIISGEEEARKTALGMLIDISPPKTALLIDIGGGSTELIFIREKEPVLVQSLNLGVVYLAERYMRHDPPTREDIKLMEDEIFRKLASVFKTVTEYFTGEQVFIGTAGTITTLAAMVQGLGGFEREKIHNYRMSIDSIKEIFSDISTASAKEKAKYPALEPARFDIIVPGTLILIKIMEILGFKEITVSDYGLREGILLELYNKSNKA
ncbi:MAG: Ppx/GppA family phosphatase [Nitrospirae bacterium]|nr:Ppx/GppA family phosphatase [Nitrospirota bacterium]